MVPVFTTGPLGNLFTAGFGDLGPRCCPPAVSLSRLVAGSAKTTLMFPTVQEALGIICASGPGCKTQNMCCKWAGRGGSLSPLPQVCSAASSPVFMECSLQVLQKVEGQPIKVCGRCSLGTEWESFAVRGCLELWDWLMFVFLSKALPYFGIRFL